MYKNLQQTISAIGIKNKDIALLINRNDSYISKRLNGSLKFDVKTKNIIFNFLKSKGYKGTSSFLFDYTEIIYKEKKDLSKEIRRLNECIKHSKVTNEQMAEYLEVSTNTISAWRNGKVEKIGYDYIEKMAEILNVTPSYLSGKYPVPNSNAYKDYDNYLVDTIDYQKRIYDAIEAYEKSRGYDIDLINKECRREMFFFTDDLIDEIDVFYETKFSQYRDVAIANKPKIDSLNAEILEKRKLIEFFEKNEAYITPEGNMGDTPIHVLKQATNDFLKDRREELEKLEDNLKNLRKSNDFIK